jgi:hypothetical protein
MPDTKTNQELAITLLHRLVHLEVEHAAMQAVLNNSLDCKTNRLLDWRPLVEKARAETEQSLPLLQYSDIEQQLLSSTPECPRALPLLIELVRRQGSK